jgi:hypothetical protein
MMTIARLRKRKKYGGGNHAYLEKVMADLAKTVKETSAELKRSEVSFKIQMKRSDADFKIRMEKSDADFKKSMEEFEKKQEQSNEEFKKRQEESKKRAKESREKFDRELAENKKDWNKRMGEIHNRLGDIAEFTFVPEAILEKFKEMGYEFDNYYRRHRIFDKDGYARAEYDIVLCNGDTVVLIEIKIVFRQEHIDRFIQQMSVATDEKYKGKKIIGAIAGLEITNEVKNYALARGLYVIEQAGEDIKIDTLGGKFKPKIW